MKLSDFVGIIFLWGIFCLPIGLIFILSSLNDIPWILKEELSTFSSELGRLIFLGAGLSWILILPTSIILERVKSKLSDLSLAFVIIIVAAYWIIGIIGNIISNITHVSMGKLELGLISGTFIGLSYLLYIPHSLTLYTVFLPLYYKSKLSTIGYRINVLRERISGYEAILDQRSRVEQNIESIVASDPSNLDVKARELQEKVRRMTYDEIKARSIKINLELSKIDSLEREAKGKLRALEDKKRDLELRISYINSRLHILERSDPANFQIKMWKLKQLEGIRREELKMIKPAGELEELFFEKIYLSYQINDVNREIRDTVEDISRMRLERLSLQLEDLILHLEEVNRIIRSMEPSLLEMKDTLKRLENERDRILSSLQQK
jgi:hypothetical protein